MDRCRTVLESLPPPYDLSNLPLLQLLSRKHSSLVFLVKLPAQRVSSGTPRRHPTDHSFLIVVKLFCLAPSTKTQPARRTQSNLPVASGGGCTEVNAPSKSSGPLKSPRDLADASPAGVKQYAVGKPRFDLDLKTPPPPKPPVPKEPAVSLMTEFLAFPAEKGINDPKCSNALRELICLHLAQPEDPSKLGRMLSNSSPLNTPSTHEGQNKQQLDGENSTPRTMPFPDGPFAKLINEATGPSAKSDTDYFGVVKIFGWGLAESYRGVLLEALGGPCLADYLLARQKPYAAAAIVPPPYLQLMYRLEWAYQLGYMIASLHRKGIFHGDIKAENFAFRVPPSASRFGALSIFDFSDAKLFSPEKNMNREGPSPPALPRRFINGIQLVGSKEYWSQTARTVQDLVFVDAEPEVAPTACNKHQDCSFDVCEPTSCCRHWPCEPPPVARQDQNAVDKILFDTRHAERKQAIPTKWDVLCLGVLLAHLFDLVVPNAVLESCAMCGQITGLTDGPLWAWVEAGNSVLDFGCNYLMGSPLCVSNLLPPRIANSVAASVSAARQQESTKFSVDDFCSARRRWGRAASAAVRGIYELVQDSLHAEPDKRPAAGEICAGLHSLLQDMRAYYRSVRHLPGLGESDVPSATHYPRGSEEVGEYCSSTVASSPLESNDDKN